MDTLSPNAPDYSAVSPEDAGPKLQQLRSDRMAGLVLDADFHERADYLARRAGGEDVQPPSRTPTSQEQLDAAAVEMMTPAKPDDYVIERSPGVELTQAQIESEVEVRQVLAAIGVPKHLGNSVYVSAKQLTQKFAAATPEVIAEHVASFRSAMEQEWGEGFPSRVVAIDELIAKAGSTSPLVTELIAGSPWILLDRNILNLLWDISRRGSHG